MPKYQVELQAIVTATVWVECSDETEAKSIAENAWRPHLASAGIDPTVEAIYDYDVAIHANTPYTFEVQETDHKAV